MVFIDIEEKSREKLSRQSKKFHFFPFFFKYRHLFITFVLNNPPYHIMNKLPENTIIEGLCQCEGRITNKYFYGYCRRAYLIYDRKYQLHGKTGLDFYSLAHEYYIYLLTHHFKPLKDKPMSMKLSTWMVHGFHFVVLDALKTYNKAFEHQSEESSDVVLEYIRTNNEEEGFLFQVAEAVATHYQDRTMQEIAHMVIYAGFKQKEVAEQLGITPAAVNMRYKKMMEEVITPFVIENYGKGLQEMSVAAHKMSASPMPMCYNAIPEFMCEDASQNITFTENMMENHRITPTMIHALQPNEIFVFGSNLQGIHAGGAARTARIMFGAEMGNGVGLQGQSYAIPTMQGGVETIRPYVDKFISYATEHPEIHFLVTPIGCGIAGFSPEEIAPLFDKAHHVENIYLPESFWDILNR